ncbi:MAG: glycosyltransferase [Phycisphaerales bacterium JB040]
MPNASSHPAPRTLQPYAPTRPTTPDAQIEPKPPRPRRIALAHDWLVGLRGGEIVLDAIARAIHDHPRLTAGPLLTLFDTRPGLTPAIDALHTHPSPLSRLPHAARRWLLPAYPAGAASLSRTLARLHRDEPIDLLVSSSSVAAKAVTPPPGVPHLCYCHTPARYLWDQAPHYARHPVRALGLRALAPALRRWDARSAAGITTLLANSRFTADRIRRAWGLEAVVLHPPVDTDYFTPDQDAQRTDAWLSVSALEPYKRVDLAISAALASGRRLLVVGTGSQERALRAHTRAVARALHRAGHARDLHTLVTFLGRVPREELRRLYRTAALLLFPHAEDFGIAAAEAQACACPVLTLRRSGAAEIIEHNASGLLIDDATPDAIAHAARDMPAVTPKACRDRAERFGHDRFRERLTRHIHDALPDF